MINTLSQQPLWVATFCASSGFLVLLWNYLAAKKQYEELLKAQNAVLLRQQQEDLVSISEHKQNLQLELEIIEERHQQLLHKLDQLNISSAHISSEAFKLTHILTGSNTHQGAWGEMVLAKILERSGMREGHEYHTQHNTGAGIPDVIITLPNGNKVIIDAKVSLTNYSQIYDTSCAKAVKALRSKHNSSLLSHISALSKKRYPNMVENSIDCTIMFMPVESAFIEAIKHNPSFLEVAFDANIIVVGPNGLFATLKVFSKIWKEDYIKNNVKEILLQNNKIETNVRKVLGNMTKFRSNFLDMKKAHDSIMKLLSHDNDSVLGCLEEIEKRGTQDSYNLKEEARSDEE